MSHDLGRPTQHPFHPTSTLVLLAGVARVQPQVAEALGQTLTRGDIHQELGAFPILDSRTMNPNFEHQTLRVYQQMALPSFDLLGPVVTTLLSAHACCLDRLAINYRCTGLRVSLEVHSLAQG